MGTKVIDKLRIQGNAAPRHVPEPAKYQCGVHKHEYHEQDHAVHFLIKEGDKIKQAPNSLATMSHPSSAASRKLDYLQRLQEANRGLTSTDYMNPSRTGLPQAHFVLCGKPVPGDLSFDPLPFNAATHQRVGHFKTSPKELYRARNKLQLDTNYYAADYPNFFRPVRSAEYEGSSAIYPLDTKPNTAHQFYLGPSPMSAPVKQSSSAKRMKLPPTPAPTLNCDREEYAWGGTSRNTYRHTLGSGDGLTLMGQPLLSSGMWAFTDSIENEQDGPPDFFTTTGLAPKGQVTMPELTSPPSSHVHLVSRRRLQQWPRTSSRDGSGTITSIDPGELKHCLKVQQSSNQPLSQTHIHSSNKPAAIAKLRNLKHQKARASGAGDEHGKVNYNNPYRNMGTRKAMSSEGRYRFNSVESYIHFNKIYPKMGDNGVVNGKNSPRSANMPRIPQVDGFSSHCTDTVLLKMMFEMNKPKSVKSVSKYSDIGLHKDLEEFMIVGTPSLCRSTSDLSRVASRKATSVYSGGTSASKTTEDDRNQTLQWVDANKNLTKDTHVVPLQEAVDEEIEREENVVTWYSDATDNDGNETLEDVNGEVDAKLETGSQNFNDRKEKVKVVVDIGDSKLADDTEVEEDGKSDTSEHLADPETAGEKENVEGEEREKEEAQSAPSSHSAAKNIDGVDNTALENKDDIAGKEEESV